MNATCRDTSRWAGLLAALTLLLVPIATAQEGGAAAAEGEPRGGLRIAHLAPEGPNVDVLVAGELLIEDLAPNTVSEYVFVQPGEVDVEIVSFGMAGTEAAPPVDPAADGGAAAPATDPAAPAGDPPAEGGVAGAPATEEAAPTALPEREEPLLRQTVTLEEAGYVTLVLSASGAAGAEGQQDEQAEAADEAEAGEPAADPAAAPAEAQVSYQAQAIQDGVQELPGAGQAMVRIVHGALSAGNVTVVTAPSGEGEQAGQEGEAQEGEEAPAEEGQGPAPIQGGQELASGLAAGEASEYAAVQAGTHHLQVQDQDGNVAVDLEEMAFESGLVYTLYVGATQDGAALVITATVDAGVSAQER